MSVIANKKGINTFNGYLKDFVLQSKKSGADLLLASNVAHADDLRSMGEKMKQLIKPKGKIIIEVQYLINTLQDLSFDNIYHEHTNYWSATVLVNFLKKIGLFVFKIEKLKLMEDL